MTTYSHPAAERGTVNDRILVPIDDSEPAKGALEEALEIFGQREFVVLHVIELEDLSHGIAGVAAEELEEAQEAQASELFDEVRDVAGDYGASIETVTGKGDAAEAIVAAADSYDVDHVVMGSHGRSGLSRIIVGSVAEQVIRESPVSVTISRPGTATDG